MRRLLPISVLLITAFLVFPESSAEQPFGNMDKQSLGNAIDYKVVPTLNNATRKRNHLEWTQEIQNKGAGFIKIRFEDFNLQSGDSLHVLSPTGRVIETLVGRGPKSKSNFWSLSVPGDTAVLHLDYRGDYRSFPPFIINQIIAGNAINVIGSKNDVSRSECGEWDYLDAACFLNDPMMATGIDASVGMMVINYSAPGNPSAVGCSGTSVSANTNIMTNNHCAPDQLTCDNAEFVFKYRRSDCNPQSALVNDWESYRCDELLVTSSFEGNPVEPYGASPDFVDMSLFSIERDPVTQFGYLDLDPIPMTSGEDVYMVHHPFLFMMSTPQQVTIGGGASVVVDNDDYSLRYGNTLDTRNGSSGASVVRASNNKIVALHHGGLNCPDDTFTPNMGALATVIAPFVDEYTCGDTLRLNFGKTGDLTELIGNGDTAVDPGESWSLTTKAVNNSCDLDTTGISGEVLLGSGFAENVMISDDVLAFGDLQAGAIASDTVTFSVPTTANCGAEISFDLIKLQDANGNLFDPLLSAFSVPLGSKVPTTIFEEHFDTGIGSWTIMDGGTGSGPEPTWAVRPMLGIVVLEPPSLFVGPRLSSGEMDEDLISPLIDVTGANILTLEYSHTFRMDSVETTSGQGHVAVRSSATGNEWVRVKSYTGAAQSGTEAIDITAYKANDLQIRFHYQITDDENAWWIVDDIYLLSDDGYVCNVFDQDLDTDGVADNFDNCVLVANADQRDTNGDGFGNICDPDLNNDGDVNFIDISLFGDAFNSSDPDADFNGDGVVNFMDYSIAFPDYYLMPPGPSGIAP